ncbi:hypothetical protein F7018_14905 [Tenacibaculum aiptasiae]|uniref:Uncharacterized protein n=1 Tax=Tenacibaculum aiptasiae TaxID=426481 RepID=A0A7J5A9N5_9FLAO|nr:hypothetical protein [Tenacibaculum aiptasiae]KAB1154257.1 hypothetical protein F7018_14905 [Tenacibaculum aiptasiae]
MKKQEFIEFIDHTLNEVKQFAEIYANRPLPNNFKFKWLRDDCETVIGRKNIINEIARLVYLSEDRIYPCVDLNIGLEEGYIFITSWIANYEPRPFQKGWSNRPGPFIYCVSSSIISNTIDTKSKDFINNLIDLGLLHYEKE